jgi:serine phosphatase RsbU (regulator of sigma subunit)
LLASGFLAWHFLKLFPFVNPVLFSPSAMNLRFLHESFKYHKLDEYVDFTTRFFQRLDRKYELGFISETLCAGHEFHDLTPERKALLYRILEGEMEYLNIDIELLNETEHAGALTEFYNLDLPRLVYPLRNENREIVAILAFGRMPGVFWPSKLAKAHAKIVKTFESFYLSIRYNTEAKESEKQLARAEEARIYQEQLAELEISKNLELEAKNKRISDSITYASLIQQSILPPDALLREAFPDYFLIWKPCDIVGGDFYWLHRNPEDSSIYFAVVDCTGHGVPGALMSISANALLDQIVGIKHVSEPKDILWDLHQAIGSSLHQQLDDHNQGGLDISLIRLRPGRISFAGAKQSIYVYSSGAGTLLRYRGDRQSVGGLKWAKHSTFAQHELDYDSSLRLYFTTDGILDQPAENGNRAGNRGWEDLLDQIKDLTFPRQKQYQEAYLARVLELGDQRDDITIAAIKI